MKPMVVRPLTASLATPKESDELGPARSEASFASTSFSVVPPYNEFGQPASSDVTSHEAPKEPKKESKKEPTPDKKRKEKKKKALSDLKELVKDKNFNPMAEHRKAVNLANKVLELDENDALAKKTIEDMKAYQQPTFF